MPLRCEHGDLVCPACDGHAIDTISLQGNLLVCKRQERHIVSYGRPEGANVREFSRESRFRMFKALAKINYAKCLPSSFLTTTIPDTEKRLTAKTLTTWRWNFWKRIERHVGRPVAAMWRVEWVPRLSGLFPGVLFPHWHFLLFNVPWIDQGELTDWWSEVHGLGKSIVYINEILNQKQAGYYVSKYVGKVESCSLVIGVYLAARKCGRHWGILRSSAVPWHKKQEVKVKRCDATDWLWRAALAERPSINEYGNESFTLLGENAAKLGKIFFDLGLPVPPTSR